MTSYNCNFNYDYDYEYDCIGNCARKPKRTDNTPSRISLYDTSVRRLPSRNSKAAEVPAACPEKKNGLSDFGTIVSTIIAMFSAAVISGSLGLGGSAVIIAFLITASAIGCVTGVLFNMLGL